MIYFMEEDKKQFSYTIKNVEHSDVSEEYLNSLSLTDEEKKEVLFQKLRYDNHIVYFERLWRDRILSMTDWLMVEDASINGEEIRQSDKFEEIKTYRKALRDYDPTIEDRPVRPKWVKLNQYI